MYNELKKELGKTPTMKEYDDKYHKRGTIYRRFGNWNNFVIKYCNDTPVQRYYTNEKCIVSSCEEKAKVKGYCKRHYAQILNNGKITRKYKHNRIVENNEYLEVSTFDKKDNVKAVLKIDIEYYSKIISKTIKFSERKGATIKITAEEQYPLSIYLFGKLEEGLYHIHKNKDNTDYRKENIYIGDKSEILRNQELQKRNKTGYKGIFKTESGSYMVSINKEYVGFTESLNEAIEMRKTAELYRWGKVYSEDTED